MKSLIKSVAFSMSLLCAGVASAQEADTTPEAETDPGAELDLGTPINQDPAEPQVGQTYTAAVFDAWELRCLKREEGPEPCQLYQLLRDSEGNAVAEFTLFGLPEGGRAAAGANIVAPLETLLTEQLTITVDGAEARRYAFTFCNAGGCVARVGFTEAEVAQFKRGNNATLRLVPAGAPDDEVVLTVSLAGFTAAMNAAEGN